MTPAWKPETDRARDGGHGSPLHRRALLLSYFTVAYNVVEGVVSILAGVMAGSIALIGFGLDSAVESLSGGIMIWRFKKSTDMSEEEEDRIEKKATKLVAYTFFILTAYILYESAEKLVLHEQPEPSLFGIIIASISIILMPILFYLKYKTGRELHSPSLIADSKETLACLFLSVALFIGLGLNLLFGWWQADPIVAIIVAILLAREGIEILSGKD